MHQEIRYPELYTGSPIIPDDDVYRGLHPDGQEFHHRLTERSAFKYIEAPLAWASASASLQSVLSP